MGSDLLTYLWSFTCGKVRTRFTQPSNEIAIVGAPMSALPDVSRFWTAATSDDTYLLTWEDFAFGRIAVPTNTSSLIPDPSSLVSAQLELFRNGNFIARANETNTVELLIGKTYEIKCDLPFKVVDSSDWRVDVWQRSPKAATVVWPVEIYMDYGYSLMSGLLQAPRLGSPSGGPWLRVDPDWLNGTVSMPTNVCCGVSGTGGEFQFAWFYL